MSKLTGKSWLTTGLLLAATIVSPAQAIDPATPIAVPKTFDHILGVDRGGALGTITAFTAAGFVQSGNEIGAGAAQVTRDGDPATIDALEIGQLVLVYGDFANGAATGTADKVVLDHRLRGTVEAIDLEAGSLLALGQTVRVNADTVIDGVTGATALEDIASGDFLLVSGYLDADGEILATRLETAPQETLAIEGVVTELDTENASLRINSQWVDYHAAALEGFPGTSPEEGDYVEVTGHALAPGGALIANVVGLDEGGFGLRAGDHVEIEGLVTGLIASDEFQMGMQAVRTDGLTEYENGTADDIALDVLLEVSGTMDGAGAINAAEVEFIQPSNAQIAANVQHIDTESGFVMALGLRIFIDAETQLEDDSFLDLQAFGMQDLFPGDRVVIRGVHTPRAPGKVFATRLVREESAPGVVLKGPVTVFEPESAALAVLGVTILTNLSNPDVVEFFQSPPGGTRVEAQGIQIGRGTMFAQEVQWMDDPP